MSRPRVCLLLGALLCSALAEVAAGPYFRTGKVYFSRKNYPKALEYFQKETQAAPGNGDAFFYIGYIHERERRPLEAVRNFQRAVELRMDRDLRLKAYWKIVLHYKYQRDWTNVAVWCRRFLKFRNLEPIRKLLEEAEQHYSPEQKRITDLLLRAEGLIAEGKPAEALPLLDQVLSSMPDHRRALWNQSQALVRMNQWARAIAPLEKLVAANDTVWQYHFRLGVCRFRSGDPDRALPSLDRALTLNTDGSAEFREVVHLRIGDAHLASDRLDLAGKAYAEAARAVASREVRSRQAYLAWRGKSYKEANRLVSTGGGKEPPVGHLVRLLLALESRQAGKAAGVEEQLHRAESEGEWLPPGAGAARLLLVDQLGQGGKDWPRLIAIAERVSRETAVREAPLFGRSAAALLASYRLRYGQALIETGRPAEAVTILEQESVLEARFQLARACAAAGQDARSAGLLKQVLDEEPGLRARATSDTHLQQLAERDSSVRALLSPGGGTSE